MNQPRVDVSDNWANLNYGNASAWIGYTKNEWVTLNLSLAKEINDFLAVALVSELSKDGYKIWLGSTVKVWEGENGVLYLSGTFVDYKTDMEFEFTVEWLNFDVEKKVHTTSTSVTVNYFTKWTRNFISSASVTAFKSETKNPYYQEGTFITRIDNSTWRSVDYYLAVNWLTREYLKWEVWFKINKNIEVWLIAWVEKITWKSQISGEKYNDKSPTIWAFLKYNNKLNTAEIKYEDWVGKTVDLGYSKKCAIGDATVGINLSNYESKYSEWDTRVNLYFEKPFWWKSQECNEEETQVADNRSFEDRARDAYNNRKSEVVTNTSEVKVPSVGKVALENTRRATENTRHNFKQEQKVEITDYTLNVAPYTLTCEVGTPCSIDLSSGVIATWWNYNFRVISNWGISWINEWDISSVYNVTIPTTWKYVIEYKVTNVKNPEITENWKVTINVGIDTSKLTSLIQEAEDYKVKPATSKIISDASNAVSDTKYTKASRDKVQEALDIELPARSALGDAIVFAKNFLWTTGITKQDLDDVINALKADYDAYKVAVEWVEKAYNALVPENKVPVITQINANCNEWSSCSLTLWGPDVQEIEIISSTVSWILPWTYIWSSKTFDTTNALLSETWWTYNYRYKNAWGSSSNATGTLTVVQAPITPPVITQINANCNEWNYCSLTLWGGADVDAIEVTASTVPWIQVWIYTWNSKKFEIQSADYSGNWWTYTYRYKNAWGSSSNATGTLTVNPQTPVNHPPVLQDIPNLNAHQIDEATGVTVDLSSYISDSNQGDTLTIYASVISWDEVSLDVNNNAKTIHITSTHNGTQNVEIEVEVKDQHWASSVRQTFTVYNIWV
jgi:hypothetical protein